MNWKRLSILTSAAALAGVLCIGAASAAVVDKTSPYSGEYFLAYNSRSGWANDANSGTMPTSVLSAKSEASPNDSDVIRVSTGEDGQPIYQVEPRNLTERIPEPEPRLQLYAARAEEPPQYGDERVFYTVDMTTDETVETLFSLRYCGENCNIWLETEDKHGITDEMVAELGAEYDYYIHHPVQKAFGEAYDRNGDGKMAIFLYDIQDGFDGASVRSYVGGFFMPADLVGTKFNNMDVIHIDTYPSINSQKPDSLVEVKSTMIHELQHLIEESACVEPDPKRPGEVRFKYSELPTWINEGLSMAAEHMFYGTLDSRIDYYNSYDYHVNTPLADWETGDALSHYSLSYLFVQYLRTQTKDFTGGGEELYKYIINSPKRSALCVENAMKQFYPYISLSDIFRNFYIALTLKEDTGLYGFGGETAFDAVQIKIYDQVSSVYLGPGAGIVSRMSSGSYTPNEVSGSAVRYVGFKSSDTAEVDMPLSNLISGETFKFRTLNLSCAERYATMYYTVDGTEPTPEDGLIYNGKPIQLLSNTNLKAVTVTPDGKKSAVMSNQYTIVEEDVELFRRTLGVDMAMEKGTAAWVDSYTAVVAPDGDVIQIASATDDAFGGGEFSELPFPSGQAYRVLVISKYGQDGTLRWNRTISGGWILDTLDTVALEDGFVIVGGGHSEFVGDFAELPPLEELCDFYSFMIKLSWDGAIQWITVFPASKNGEVDGSGHVTTWNNNKYFVGAASCADGGIVGAGYTDYPSNFTEAGHISTWDRYDHDGNAMLAKVDRQGNLLWEKTIDGNYVSSFRDVAVLKDGTIVAVGFVDPRSIGSGSWADCPQPGRSMRSVPVAVGFDQEGNILWMETFPYGDNYYPSFGDMIAVEDGFVAVGSTVGRFKADKTGCECLWHNEIFGYVNTVAPADDGLLVALSASSSSLEDDMLGTPLGEVDIGIVKYDLDGNITWQKRYSSNYLPKSGDYRTYSLLPLGERRYAASGNSWWIYNEVGERVLDPHSFLAIFYDESIPYYTVSGNVGRPGVSIGGKLSDSQGNYSVKVMEGESITLTPTLNGYTFEPASRTVGPVEADLPNQDFTPTEIKYTVSGTVLDPDGKPLAGVSVGGTTTGADGKYSIQVRPGVNVVLTPVLDGKVFEPTSRTITGISGNVPNQDFRVPRPKFKVSGTVTRDGVGQGGVKVGDVLTDSDGHYEIVVEQGTDLTLAPKFFRYTFTPVQIPLTNISADTPEQNFTMDLTPAMLLVDSQSLDLGSVKVGYAPVSPRSVTVRNGGYIASSGLRVELAEGSNFVLDTSSLSETFAAGGSTTFTVKPKDGLAVGSYSETITVTDGDNTLNITITFEVTAEDKPDPDKPDPDKPDPDKPDPDKPDPDKPDPDKPDPDKPDPDKPDPDKPDPDKPDPDKPDPDKPDPDKPDPDKPDPDKPDPDKPDPDKPDNPGDDNSGDDEPSSGSSGGGGSSKPSSPSKPSAPEPTAPQETPVTTLNTPYVNGYDDGAFLPEANLTRGQCAAILSRLMGGFDSNRSYGRLPFPDVREDAWYYAHIAYMTSQGLIRGYPDGTFRPDEPITRAEFSTLVRNVLRLENASECDFPDVQSHWAVNPIGQLTQAGILDGYPDGTFRPDQHISRAEAVKVLNGAYRRTPDQSVLSALGVPFTDLYSTHWAYYEILEAAVEHQHIVK